MDLGVILLLAFFAWLAWFMLKPGKGKVRYCTRCGTEAETVTKTRGSLGIEIVLWLCFIIPGVIYSLWRMNARRHVCRSCGSAEVIDPKSPVAVKLKQ